MLKFSLAVFIATAAAAVAFVCLACLLDRLHARSLAHSPELSLN